MKKVLEILSAIGGAIASFFVNMPPLVWILIAVMTIDYITGLITGCMGKSKKTENGYLASGEAWKGLMKKGLTTTRMPNRRNGIPSTMRSRRDSRPS